MPNEYAPEGEDTNTAAYWKKAFLRECRHNETIEDLIVAAKSLLAWTQEPIHQERAVIEAAKVVPGLYDRLCAVQVICSTELTEEEREAVYEELYGVLDDLATIGAALQALEALEGER